MKGRNFLLINHASMVEALQHYVEKEFGDSENRAVHDVEYDSATGYFRIHVQSPEDPNQLKLPLDQTG